MVLCIALSDAEICPVTAPKRPGCQHHSFPPSDRAHTDRPSSDADFSPFRRRSRSAWIEFVWRTPCVYSEFMAGLNSKQTEGGYTEAESGGGDRRVQTCSGERVLSPVAQPAHSRALTRLLALGHHL